MIVREDVTLASYTSLSVGGPARFLIEAVSEPDVRAAARFAASKHLPLLPLGGGTNILVPDDGVDAAVLFSKADSFSFVSGEDRTVLLIADAGAPWDALVAAAGERELWGIENLAGIPGRAAGALVQNIGAYGAELADVFAYADVFDPTSHEAHRITPTETKLTYRSSIFKKDHALIILRIALALTRSGAPRIAYADLARAQDAGPVPSSPYEIAAVVRAIRREKFPRVGAEGTAGSFFKNPIVSKEHAERLTAQFPGLPAYPEPDDRVKLSLAWLLDHALGLRGYTEGTVRLFERQPIVLVASSGASAADIDAFACSIERRVLEGLGISIEREVEMFGPLLESASEASARTAPQK